MEVSIAAHFIILFTKKLLQVTVMVGGKNSYWQNQHTRCTSMDFSRAKVRGGPGHDSLGHTPGQPGKSAAKKAKESKMFIGRRRQHLHAKDSTCRLQHGGKESPHLLQSHPKSSCE